MRVSLSILSGISPVSRTALIPQPSERGMRARLRHLAARRPERIAIPVQGETRPGHQLLIASPEPLLHPGLHLPTQKLRWCRCHADPWQLVERFSDRTHKGVPIGDVHEIMFVPDGPVSEVIEDSYQRQHRKAVGTVDPLHRHFVEVDLEVQRFAIGYQEALRLLAEGLVGEDVHAVAAEEAPIMLDEWAVFEMVECEGGRLGDLPERAAQISR